LVNDACKYDDGQLRYINFRSLLSILYLAFGFFNNTEKKTFENNNGEAVLTSNECFKIFFIRNGRYLSYRIGLGFPF
jgi:hypothetical protein